MVRCPTPVGYLINPYGVIYPAPCNKWGCPVCSVKKKKQLADRISQGFSKNGHRTKTYMLTLTEYKGPGSLDSEIMKHWDRLRSSLAKHDIKLKYFWVKEFKPLYSERGDPDAVQYRHLHVLVDSIVDIDLLRHLWYLATDKTATEAYISGEKIGNAAGYALKYMGKSFEEAGNFWHEKRYNFSKGDFPTAADMKVNPLIPWAFMMPDDSRWAKADSPKRREEALWAIHVHEGMPCFTERQLSIVKEMAKITGVEMTDYGY